MLIPYNSLSKCKEQVLVMLLLFESANLVNCMDYEYNGEKSGCLLVCVCTLSMKWISICKQFLYFIVIVIHVFPNANVVVVILFHMFLLLLTL